MTWTFSYLNYQFNSKIDSNNIILTVNKQVFVENVCLIILNRLTSFWQFFVVWSMQWHWDIGTYHCFENHWYNILLSLACTSIIIVRLHIQAKSNVYWILNTLSCVAFTYVCKKITYCLHINMCFTFENYSLFHVLFIVSCIRVLQVYLPIK
jgi:hypothetical protein